MDEFGGTGKLIRPALVATQTKLLWAMFTATFSTSLVSAFIARLNRKKRRLTVTPLMIPLEVGRIQLITGRRSLQLSIPVPIAQGLTNCHMIPNASPWDSC